MTTGSKVICVDDRFPPEIIPYYNQLPIKDKVYLVRAIGVGVSVNGEPGEVVVYLDGLDNPSSVIPPHPERGFAQFRFRELEPPKEEAQTIKNEDFVTA